MIDASFLDGLARFNLIIRKKVTSNFAGPRKSIAQGRGIIFSDHRIYAPGDDFRSIDWKIYARTDDLMIKNFEEERNLVVHIIVDKSLSMGFGKPSKFDYASMIGVGFAYLSLKKNDKFQFATFSDDIDVYQPRRGVSQLISMIDYLNKIKMAGKTDILTVMQKYRPLLGTRALIVIISDFLMPLEHIKEALCYFGRNEVTLIQVLSDVEKTLEVEGDFKLRDSETSSVMRAYLSPLSRTQYLEKLENHSSQIEHECNVMGMKFCQVTTSMPIFDAFYKVLG